MHGMRVGMLASVLFLSLQASLAGQVGGHTIPDPASDRDSGTPAGGALAGECNGVGWPADYAPLTDAIEAPSARIPLRAAAVFPINRVGPVDRSALLADDAARDNLGQPPRIGITVPLAPPLSGEWVETADGGRLWTLQIVADGATALRLRMARTAPSDKLEIYVYGAAEPTQVRGPYAPCGPEGNGEFWTASVVGDTTYVEVLDPDGLLSGVPVQIDQVAYFYHALDGSDGLRGTLDCMGDVACYPTWLDVSHAVARLAINQGGSWISCSGTLVAAQNGDLTPYFLTAAHCVDTQTEASSMEFQWFYQRASCGGPFMTVQASYDAQLLGTSGASVGADWTLLMIRGVLPPGLYWSGWTSSTLAPDTWSDIVHHPSGDWKRYSRGLRNVYDTFFDQIHFDVLNAVGTIYFGSSGSGIWTESDQKLFGTASWVSSDNAGCDFLSTFGGYGRFSTYYSAIATLLAAGSDDTFEPDNTCAAAAPAGNGAHTNLVVKSSDEDWYSLLVGAGAQLTVTLTFTHAYGNINAQLYGACGGAVLVSATGTGNSETINYTNPGAQATFYLRVFLANDTRNEYTLTVSGAYSDCNQNGMSDACELSCGSPGGPCFGIPGCGQAHDCNLNNTIDECETLPDCQPNGILDVCDLVAGTSFDCQADGIPDECQTDCNANQVPDDCDLALGTSADCQPDGTPDECQTAGNDCNVNTIPDGCDITAGTSIDCQPDGTPDECQLAANDCDANARPDECDPDCNQNGIADSCDIAAGTTQDCNANGRPDQCDTEHCHYLWNGFQDAVFQTPMHGLDLDGDGHLWTNPGATATIWALGCETGGGTDLFAQVYAPTTNPENGYVVSEYFRTDGGTLYPDEDVYSLSFRGRLKIARNAKTDWQFLVYDATNSAPAAHIQFASTVSSYPGISVPADRGYILVKNRLGSPTFVNTGIATVLNACTEFRVELNNLDHTVQLYVDGTPRLNPPVVVLNAEARRLDYFRLTAVSNGAASGGNTIMELDALHLCATGLALPADQWDCNGNGVLDECDITSGLSADCNVNGLPEECERGDFNGDLTVNLTDYQAFQACYTGPGVALGVGCTAGDFDCDNDVDLHDSAAFQFALPAR